MATQFQFAEQRRGICLLKNSGTDRNSAVGTRLPFSLALLGKYFDRHRSTDSIARRLISDSNKFMWTKLDDALIDHRKVYIAGDLIGKNGPAIVIGFFAVGLMWTNKHLTDGHLPEVVVKRFRHVDQPLQVAEAMVKAGLWDTAVDGFQIHDFHQHNPTAASVKKKREKDRLRKESERTGDGQ